MDGRRNPFARPTGVVGRLAGWVMGRDAGPHREVAELLAPGAGAAVCEVGFGPGQLLTVLATRDRTVRLCGVDPSAVMLTQARRRLARTGVAADLRLGVAEALPFPDRSVDHVVAVNSAAIWPDLAGAVAEAHRMLRPGGTLLLAWHSSASPQFVQRRLARSDEWWRRLVEILRHEFGNARRQELTHTTVGTAVTQV
jgi:ubiquinone/menaquinone biosynthesis C-methylase UbiE